MTDERDITDPLAYLRDMVACPGGTVPVRAAALVVVAREFDAARARIAALEAALRDVCEAAEEPCYFEYKRCTVCGRNAYLPEHHAPDCPVAAALALLADA